MLAAATLIDASALPDCLSVVRLEAIREPRNPMFPIIERCLAPEPHKRFPSPTAIAEACAASSTLVNHAPRSHAEKATVDFMRLSCNIGDAIVGDAVREGERIYWVSHHPTARDNPLRDVYTGSAGTALFLCALYDATGLSRYLDAASGCGEWLWNTEPIVPRQIDMPGLYFGESGVGLLYLALHRSSRDTAWLDRACAVGERVPGMGNHSPDIMTGAAGAGLFHLALWHVTGDDVALHRARLAAKALLQMRAEGRPTWVIPPNHEGLSGNEYIGFSHGSAGIGYFLAEYCLARHDPEVDACCLEIADWILTQGRPCLH
jgi:lantibiotic modifying enzyme